MLIVLFENKLDEKALLWRPINAMYVEKSYVKMLASILFSSIDIIHLRYLRINSLPYALVRYGLLLFLASITKTPVVWTLHNIIEHKSHSKVANKLLRNFLLDYCKFIFVIDEAMISFVPNRYHDKIRVTPFGLLKSPNLHRYASVANLDLICVTASKDTFVKGLIRSLGHQIKYLVIAPSSKITGEHIINEFASVDWTSLSSSSKLVGFIPHTNGSVSTGLQMFAQRGVPMIAYNESISGHIILRESLGECIYDLNELIAKIDIIQNNYSHYSKSVIQWSRMQTWDTARNVLAKSYECIIYK